MRLKVGTQPADGRLRQRSVGREHGRRGGDRDGSAIKDHDLVETVEQRVLGNDGLEVIALDQQPTSRPLDRVTR
jgi:hypothetical protein